MDINSTKTNINSLVDLAKIAKHVTSNFILLKNITIINVSAKATTFYHNISLFKIYKREQIRES